MADACRSLIVSIGEDPARDGLQKTPMRMARALMDLTAGYGMDAGAILRSALFDVESAEMVLVKDIEFSSMCEHHVLPFFGKVHIAYLPDRRVVGLSKLARVTDVFARRLQVQERMTQQIADAVAEHVGARGVCVIVEATHMCMVMRGVQKLGSATVTRCYRGLFESDGALRDEVFRMLGR